MKKHLLLVAGWLCAVAAVGQAPLKFNYQAVARDSGGNLIAGQSVGVRISIHDSLPAGTIVYQENHTATTNIYGLFTLEIGGGNPLTGTMADVNWTVADKFLQIELDPSGGSSYTDMGTTQLLSVPYAMYAASGPSTYVSAFTPAGCTVLPLANGTYQKIGDMGTFTVFEDGTFVEVEVATSFSVNSMGGAGVAIQMRVDDNVTTIGQAAILLRQTGISIPGIITGVFSGLTPGTHTVSLWARTNNNQTATDVYWDAGCFNSFGVNNVRIKEFR